MSLKQFFSIFLCCLSFAVWSQQIQPDRFIKHRVKAKETLYGLTQKYNISIQQLLDFNPLVEKVGLKKRMNLRIPVYLTQSVSQNDTPQQSKDSTPANTIHTVKPKETKWRLAYQYGTTIAALEALNPHIKAGLKIGQTLKIPSGAVVKPIPEQDDSFNYYTVLPKEGYYRIEKKLGVGKAQLDSLNPQLLQGGLKAGMILKIPKKETVNFQIQDDLLIERVSLMDSMIKRKNVNLALLLPFKLNAIPMDSLHLVQDLMRTRNLHTVALDFYFGVRMAAETAAKAGISVDMSVFDTQNSMMKIRQMTLDHDFSSYDALIGPLIPTNFNYAATLSPLREVPKVSPLSTVPITIKENVYQSVSLKQTLRDRMFEYLERELDTTHHVVVIADSLNRGVENELMKRFPRAISIRPEKSGYVLPELLDTLLVDSLPNKVILETESFPVISSVLSQINAQNTVSRTVQLFTTYRDNIYDSETLSRNQMGGVQFTYTSHFKPLAIGTEDPFKLAYIRRFGKVPNREAIRGYDLVLDIILRIAFSGSIQQSVSVGETEYNGNRFYYVEDANGGYRNMGYYILQHQGYDVVELKK